MALRDLLIFALVCLAWAMNTIVTKLIVSIGVPPLFMAFFRFAVVLAVVFPWLRPIPRPLGRVLIVGALMGAGGFGFSFIGIQTASPSAAGIVSQVGAPMMMFLSVVVLGEKLVRRRVVGALMAIAGCVLVIWDPSGVKVQVGLLFVAGGCLMNAVATIMMKQIRNVSPLQFQAWVGLTSAPLVLGASLIFETGQVEAVRAHLWPIVGAAIFTGLIASVVGHTTYYWLIRRYDMSLLAPLTLMTPLMTIVLGVWLTHDAFGPRLAMGAAITLTGVLIIAVKPSQWRALLRSRIA